MNIQECTNEKWSSRTVGVVMLILALPIGFFGSLIVPVLGLAFALPLLVFAMVLIAAPGSKVCRLIMRRASDGT